MLAFRSQLATCSALAVALVTVICSNAPDAAGRARSCKQAKSKTIDQNSRLRVFRTSSGKLYVCRRSSGRRTELDKSEGDEVLGGSYRNVRLAGTYVAWESVSVSEPGCRADCPPGTGDGRSSRIEVYDARRDRRRTLLSEALGRALVLSRSGGVAWATRATGSAAVEIHGSVRRGDDRVLDTGNIDPKSLAIEITIVSWKRDGIERFARLR